MIFTTYEELNDSSIYRERAMHRKMEYYKTHFPETSFGIHQLEFEVLDCIERAREIEILPFVDVIEKGNATEARRSTTLRPTVSCGMEDDGRYCIYYSWDMPVKLGRYIDRLFGEPWSENRIKLNAKDGIEYNPFEKSIYEFSCFSKFNKSRSELSNYIRKMAIWFVGLHELAHIKNGHLDFVEEIRAGDREVCVDTMRALEVHADLTASDMLLHIIEKWRKYYEKPQLIVRGGKRYPGTTYCDEITFTALAAYLSLRLFLKRETWDEYTVGMHEFKQEKHPLVELRMAIVFNYFLDGLIRLGKTAEEQNAFAGCFYMSVQQFEECIFQNESVDGEDRLYYKPTELLRTEKGKEYFHRIFGETLGLNELLGGYTTTLSKVDGAWADYETLPERMFWS